MSEATLIEFLQEMEMAAKNLQGKLVSRDTQGIWEALEQQEKVVEKLSSVPMQNVLELSGVSKRNERVGGLLDRSRSLLRTNRALSQTFLQVIDRTLSQLGNSGAPAYSGYGPATTSRRSVLINQQG